MKINQGDRIKKNKENVLPSSVVSGLIVIQLKLGPKRLDNQH
jgi:hypothetical protein